MRKQEPMGIAKLFLLFFISFFVSYLLVPIVIKLNIMDHTNKRKIHDSPTPKAGGLAVYFACFITMLGFYIFTGSVIINFKILVLALLVMIIGFIDDYLELRPKTKLFLQILVGVSTIYSGYYFDLFSIIAIDYLATMIWIVGFINAFNLLDGMDGLAAGVFIITLVGFSIFLDNNVFATVTIAFMGAGAGFLYYNYPPAKVFLGDTGSLLLGYLLSLLAIVITQNMYINFFEKGYIIFFVLFIPIFDTALTIVRRYINGEPIFKPDRSHFYNLLQDLKGFTTRQVINLVYIINITTVLLSLLVFSLSTPALMGITLFFFIIVVYLVVKNNFLIVDSKLEDKKL